MAEVGKRGYFYAKCAETRPKDLLLSWGRKNGQQKVGSAAVKQKRTK